MEKRIITTDVTEEDFSLEGYFEGLYRGCEAEA